MKHSTRQSQKGATLIEVLVAILIFSFGLLGLVGLQSRAIQFSGNSEDRNIAASLAAEAAAQMYTLRSATAIPSAVETAWVTKVAASLPGGLGAIGPLVPATATTPALRTITVTWQPTNSTNVSTYTTDVMAVVNASVPQQVPTVP
ncbi:MAG: type pilus modification protein PilV [Pseudomonadota bacterium]|jgi:type IV pilus assembly protein PilV